MSKQILIIDDDPVVRMLLGECLKVNGFTVEAHESGKTGIPWLISQTNKPSLVFVDLMMPDMTGFDIIKQIRADESVAKIPVILLSAMADKKLDAQAGENKPDRYLEKPWDMTKLLATISELVPESK